MPINERGILLRHVAKHGDSGVSLKELKKFLGWDKTTFNINFQEAEMDGEIENLPNGNIRISSRLKGQF